MAEYVSTVRVNGVDRPEQTRTVMASSVEQFLDSLTPEDRARVVRSGSVIHVYATSADGTTVTRMTFKPVK